MSARRRGAAVASSLLALGAALAAVAPRACPGRDSGAGGPTPSASEVTPLADTASIEEALRFGAFGTVHPLRAPTADAPAHVLLFLTGDGGWDSTARHIARQLAAVDAVVVGVDGRTYLDALRRAPGRCVYPAAALEALSQYVQKRLGRPHYEPPVLVGHSSGAALAYATLAVVLSGDGGWASIDRQLAGAFAARGLPTVGLNSLQYLWRGSTADSAARDLTRVLRHYLPAWRKERVVLVGYSLGAEVLPFMTSRLPADLRARVRLVALLAPSRSASFEFHVTDWIPGAGGGGTTLPTRPEIAKLRGTPLLCFYGGGETDSACPGLDPGVATVVRMGSGHHLGGDYEAIAGRILAALR